VGLSRIDARRLENVGASRVVLRSPFVEILHVDMQAPGSEVVGQRPLQCGQRRIRPLSALAARVGELHGGLAGGSPPEEHFEPVEREQVGVEFMLESVRSIHMVSSLEGHSACASESPASAAPARFPRSFKPPKPFR
jgi:hypothetical protein